MEPIWMHSLLNWKEFRYRFYIKAGIVPALDVRRANYSIKKGGLIGKDYKHPCHCSARGYFMCLGGLVKPAAQFEKFPPAQSDFIL
jgi:hypothetical protein